MNTSVKENKRYLQFFFTSHSIRLFFIINLKLCFFHFLFNLIILCFCCNVIKTFEALPVKIIKYYIVGFSLFLLNYCYCFN